MLTIIDQQPTCALSAIHGDDVISQAESVRRLSTSLKLYTANPRIWLIKMAYAKSDPIREVRYAIIPIWYQFGNDDLAKTYDTWKSSA